ncbi:MAG: uroporphyrinogen decarboxylase family protein, partial [Candidatus Zixiibacteriota bacterium]
MDLKESLFIKACYCRNDGPIPIWIMRQAGRYLPEYRAVREKTSFQELCRSPQLIAEVVRQPVERFGLDASILFSDILTLLEPMGAQVEFPEGGPRILNRIENPDDVYRLKSPDIDSELSFVFDGINRIKQTLPSVPLIGFAGSPFTLACYLIEGGGSKNFDRPKRFLHEHPEAAVHLFDLLTESIARYLLAQVDAGADAI